MEVIYQGWIKHRPTLERYHVQMTFVEQGDISSLIALQRIVVAHLKNKTSYYPLTKEEFEMALTPHFGLVLGAFVQKELIGFRVIMFPNSLAHNLGSKLSLAAEELNQVVHLEAVCIHPDFQGNGLQRIMTRLVLERLIRTGAARHVLLTVSPDNLASIKNTFANQLYIARLRYMYGRRLRYIFYQDLGQPIRLDVERSLTVPYADLEQQMAAFERGYYGYQLAQRENDLYLMLAKRKGDSSCGLA